MYLGLTWLFSLFTNFLHSTYIYSVLNSWLLLNKVKVVVLQPIIRLYHFQNTKKREAWMAQIMISRSWDRAHIRLPDQRSLCLSACLCCLCLSVSLKWINNKKKNTKKNKNKNQKDQCFWGRKHNSLGCNHQFKSSWKPTKFK